jgi:ATP-dependent Clp endopeptidase proteolytic subunit ClpP
VIKEKTISVPLPRSLYLSGYVSSHNINDIVKSVIEIRESDYYLYEEYKTLGAEYHPAPIVLYINSCGGDVLHGMGIMGIMGETKTSAPHRAEIYTFCLGVAASMALIIFLGGKQRYCSPLSRFMIHSLQDIAFGDPTDIQTEAELDKDIQKTLNKIITSTTKITPLMLRNKMVNKHDWWITANEAKKLGIVDGFLV